MAVTKNALIRYLTLDKCLGNPGRKYFIDDLVKACNEALQDVDPDSTGVRKRQVQADLKFLEDPKGFEAPIARIKDGKRTFYRYQDIHFSITNQPLNEQEAQLLRESIYTLSRFQGLPQFEWLEELKARLEQSFKLKSEKEVMSFDENPYLKGKDHLSALYNAIINQQALTIAYQPFQKEEQNLEISPWYLKQFNNRWYLLALNHAHEDKENPHIYPLDRIVSIKENNTAYQPNAQIDFNEYFEDVIGVTIFKDKKVETIKLKIDQELWPYIETKPLHGSQKILERNEDHIIIQLQVIPNYELESLIFSRGEAIEILEPEHLREKFAKRVEKLMERYKI